MDLMETRLAQETIYRGKILTLDKDTVSLPNGRTALREVVHHCGGVCILPMDEDGNVYLVEQFRYPYHAVLLEAPAGKLEPKEDPFACAQRELREEAGAIAQRYTSLGKLYPSPAYLDEVIYLYLAENLSFGDQHLDEDEFLTVKKMPLAEAIKMVVAGEISDAKTQVILMKTALLRHCI